MSDFHSRRKEGDGMTLAEYKALNLRRPWGWGPMRRHNTAPDTPQGESVDLTLLVESMKDGQS